jgi:glycosyltransferase involved in cell wall biosynthesis
VLWLGNVILRKGIQYLIEAAQLLHDSPVRFIVAGMIGVRRSAIAQAPPNIEWLGEIPRSDTHQIYTSCDIFVLPTISDGFAITQLEALAYGLPVITTPNCGRVVEDGVTGFIIPPRDPASLAIAIERFLKDRSLAASMRPHCLAAVRVFSVDAYAERLSAVFGRLVAN